MVSKVVHATTFLGRVREGLPERGDATAVTYLADGEEEGERRNYAEVDIAARRVAASLQQSGVQQGDRVILLESPGPNLVAGFLGCVYAGAIAVPAYPPSPFLGAVGVHRLRGIFRDAVPAAVLTSSSLVESVRTPELDTLRLTWLATDAPLADAADYTHVDASPSDVVFLQYTSGSTSAPRGVRVTQAALAAHIGMIEQTFNFDDDTVAASWLPPFHDMGLIATLLTPLTVGFPVVQMTPESFLRRPERWLRAITRYRVTFSPAPDFAYALCVRRVRDHTDLNLSSWTIAASGAEPVREQTLAAFSAAFADCGFAEGSFWSCYGLAEATLCVSAARRGIGKVLQVDAAALGAGKLVESTGPGSKPLVACGTALPGTTVDVVDPDTYVPVADGDVGEIRVGGPHVCDGYWNRPDLTATVFPDGRLMTGDLGVMRDGELFVTGRIKDLLIVRGRNLYPQDLEQTMETADPDLRPGRGVAVSVAGENRELLVLIQEPTTRTPDDPDRIIGNMQRLVTEEHGVTPDVIVLIAPGTLPKTTSGKLQRSAAAKLFNDEQLRVVARWNAPGVTP